MSGGKLTAAFAGGGTGGHIYPGLAVAAEVRKMFAAAGKDIRIVWIGSKKALDREIVSAALDKDGRRVVDEFCPIHTGKLRRYFSWSNFTDVFKVLLGFFDSIRCLSSERPQLLFSKGGFVSVPPCAAAKMLGIKVFTHECDFTPGLATRLNAWAAEKILVSYPETAAFIKAKYRDKVVVTGNPVRSAFYYVSKSDAIKGRAFLGIADGQKPVVFFIGGSLGAEEINTLVKNNIDWLCKHFDVVHQTGKNDGGRPPKEAAFPLRQGYFPFDFIHSEMTSVLAAADIVVSRAGASAIWECAVMQKPMVLIPLCGEGTRGDQVDNAMHFARQGAAIALVGKEATGEHLCQALETLLDLGERQKMSEKCREMTGKARPAEGIAKMIFEEHERSAVFEETRLLAEKRGEK